MKKNNKLHVFGNDKTLGSLDLEPGDILVIMTDDDNPQELMEMIKKQFNDNGMKGIGIMVTPLDTKLAVIKNKAKKAKGIWENSEPLDGETKTP
jgi:superfamily I DNA and RNA helicase